VPAPRVLIPVNRLDRAKARLADVLTPGQREQLAIATLTTVYAAALQATGMVTVLTADERVRAALPPDVDIFPESPAVSGLNAQLTRAVARLSAGDTPLLILHADLPLATVGAIRALIAAASPQPSATIVRSPDGGTNAMLLSPPGRFELAYGPDSAAKHEANASAAGFAVTIHHSPALELDLDRPIDLTTLLALPGGPETSAGAALTAMHLPALSGRAG
jgi:2-phospho-L-lactate/phosphoenolpyruvate guanylyltransferase